MNLKISPALFVFILNMSCSTPGPSLNIARTDVCQAAALPLPLPTYSFRGQRQKHPTPQNWKSQLLPVMQSYRKDVQALCSQPRENSLTRILSAATPLLRALHRAATSPYFTIDKAFREDWVYPDAKAYLPFVQYDPPWNDVKTPTFAFDWKSFYAFAHLWGTPEDRLFAGLRSQVAGSETYPLWMFKGKDYRTPCLRFGEFDWNGSFKLLNQVKFKLPAYQALAHELRRDLTIHFTSQGVGSDTLCTCGDIRWVVPDLKRLHDSLGSSKQDQELKTNLKNILIGIEEKSIHLGSYRTNTCLNVIS